MSERYFRDVQFLNAFKNSQSWLSFATRWLHPRFKTFKFESFPREVGIWPEKLLPDESIISSPRALPRNAGMGPSNELYSKASIVRLGRSSPMLGGNAFPSILYSRLRDIREERLKKESGISPESLLSSRSKYSKLLSWPSSPGMLPLS